MVKAGVGEPEKLKNKMLAILREEPGVVVDYVEAVDPESLLPMGIIKGRVVILIAVRVGRTRLIDNVLVS